MAEKKGFDLGAALAAVSNSGTQADRAQIVRYDIDAIYPDPGNFYSMSGIEELMASIELVGLQQPLLVRQHPEKPAAVMIVSGHRRREAIKRLVDEGREDLRTVPCLLEAPAASAELQELKLIYANSDTRRLSSAEISAQAERVEALLYELKEQGYEFPGRMRDHVAEACKVSKSKLARLKVIRDKLLPEAMQAYQAGTLSEDPAYELARLPEDTQGRVISWLKSRKEAPRYWYAHSIVEYAADLKRVETFNCPAKLGGEPCSHKDAILEKVWRKGYKDYCFCASGDRCCATCPSLASCSTVCDRMAEKAEKLRKEQRAKIKELKEAEKSQQAPLDQIRTIWLRFGNALSRANMEDSDLRKLTGYKIYQLDDEKISLLEAGEAVPRLRADTVLPFSNSFYLHEFNIFLKTADALNCSMDYLFCRTDVPEVNMGQAEPAQAPAEATGQLQICAWMPGGTLPREPGTVVAVFDYGEKKHSPQVVRFDGERFKFLNIDAEIDAEPLYWMQLPPDPEGGTEE